MTQSEVLRILRLNYEDEYVDQMCYLDLLDKPSDISNYVKGLEDTVSELDIALQAANQRIKTLEAQVEHFMEYQQRCHNLAYYALHGKMRPEANEPLTNETDAV